MVLTGINYVFSVILLAAIIWLPSTIHSKFFLIDLIGLGVSLFVSCVTKIIMDIPPKQEIYGIRPNNMDNPSDDRPLSDEEQLVNEYINQLIAYCLRKGHNATLHSENNKLWLVKVDDNNGEYIKLLDLTESDNGKLSKDTLSGYIGAACKFIDEKINSLDVSSNNGGNNE